MVAKQSPAKSVADEEIDPQKTDPDEWDAGVNEWMKRVTRQMMSPWSAPNGKRSCAAAPLDLKEKKPRPKKRVRQWLTIKSLRPPPCVVADAKSVSDAESALSEAKEKLSDAWFRMFRQLPENVKEAWTLHHKDIGGDEFPEFYLRPRTPSVAEFPPDLLGDQKRSGQSGIPKISSLQYGRVAAARFP